MKKIIVVTLSLFLILDAFVNVVFAYNWVKEYDFPARRIVYVPRGYDNFDHIVYSFSNAQGRPCLLFVCHGTFNNQEEYLAYMGGNFYRDYAAAVDNEIRYHINRGEIGANSFEKVYFLTCHSGYAEQQEVTMPVLNKNLRMVIYNKGVQGLKEYFDSQWKVNRVVLLQDHPEIPWDGIGGEIFDDVIIADDSED